MALVLIGFLLILLFDLIPLLRGRSPRDTLTFLFIFIPALTLTMLRGFKVEVPSVLKLLGDLLKSVGISY